jgi:S-adenosylmethionine:tRNA ribosyltransferase-isomerase
MEVPEYELPEAAIAQQPTEPRDTARLLDATDAAGKVVHRRVRDLPELLRPGDVLVVNTSRVLPARLRLTKATGGAAEVLLHGFLTGWAGGQHRARSQPIRSGSRGGR